ncbi:MAG: leucine-rich repeat domain-containing protein [Faecalibacterium sp.]|jgi:hypothetical protein|nr:leucine-rich repeat domain-containing protein [Faecalibacterium sp.]
MPADFVTPGLTLEYIPCAGGARLVRVYGDTPCPVLPAQIAGLPLTELGPYCFAETQRESELPPASALRRAITDKAGTAVAGAALPAAEVSLHRIGGSFLESVTLPKGLHTIGSCAFYNCRRLQSLSVAGGIETYGSDVFLNTFLLHTLVLRAAPDAASSLFRLVNNLTGDVEVRFMFGETVQAAAFYPEYWEDIEETPAHILLHNYSGQGYHYRQCFLEGVPRWAEYDAVFPMARAEDPPAAMALLAFGRLRWPWALEAPAAAQYRAFLAAHGGEAVAVLQKREDTEALAALLALHVLDAPALQRCAVAAADAGSAAFAALLTDALHTGQADAMPKAARYDFAF